ncbi:MAG: plastocyanin/azurin family copper-binding protein [Candidatus Eremiobacteraeota bacterium]|nr:plastocyanin/azurin family copper-binding protein [Candidatus Eremiobacteraeota bacterium]
MMVRKEITCLVASASLLALAACNNGAASPPPFATGPGNFTITAGGSMNMEAMQALRFYPSTLTIDAGDTVTWKFPSGEPHTVTLLGPRPALPPPNDPAAPVPAGGSTYDGSAYTSSGFQLLGKSYSVTFPTPGTYTFACLLHGGMTGTIVVQPAGAPYPASNNAALAGAAAAQSADLALGTSALAQFPYPAGGKHLAAGMTPGLAMGMPSAVTILRFLDAPDVTATSVTVHAGDTVTWTNQSNNEPHTVTVAPAGAPFPTLNPFAPPSGGTVYDGSTLVNSGVLPPGASFALKFTTLGTFTYHCIFHDDTENMIGTVVVIP